jgi:hypothetical protein
MKLSMLLIVWILGTSCHVGEVSQLETVCVRYVDGDGFLRGHSLMFNSSGARKALRSHEYAHSGACIEGLQGQPQRVSVCLAKSSRCAHDRTTGVWEHDVERYFERYPGSHKGPCTSECSKHKDDCVSKLSRFKNRESTCRQYGAIGCEDPFTIPIEPDCCLLPPNPPEEEK